MVFLGADGTAVERSADAAVARLREVLPGIYRLLAQASLDDAEGEEPLTLTQQRLLGRLAEGCRLTSELAERLGLSPSTVSAVVDGLVRRGLVERLPPGVDRRTTPLRATPAGAAAAAAARRRQDRALAELLAHLSPAELQALGSGLAGLRRALTALHLAS